MIVHCDNNLNYIVFGLLDLKNKNILDKKEAWNQVSVTKIIQLDPKTTNIFSIFRVYNKVIINSIELVETNNSIIENMHGKSLTGKKLIVFGDICEKLMYTSSSNNDSLHATNINIPFCTEIIVPSIYEESINNINIFACTEDVYIDIINCSTLYINVIMFLVAKKSEYL